jgi:tetratricopeptide (TPR) repeat protein
MGKKARVLVWVLPLLFVGAIFYLAWSRDHDFWWSSRALYRGAQEAAAHGDGARALELARKAWTRNPDNPEFGALLVRIYLDAGRGKAALEVARQMMEHNPGPGPLMIYAQALERLGETQEALDKLACYLQRQPDDRAILKAAAVMAARQEKYQPLAVTYYQRLYALDHDPQVRRLLVKLLASQNQYKEAITLQQEEAAEFPEDQEAMHYLALLYYWQRDYQASSDIYQGLLEKGAADSALRLEAAKVAEAAHDSDRALNQYLWLYARHHGQKEYALALARLWAQKGNHAEAAGVLGPLMRQAPDLELRRWYALELLLIGDFDKAQREYHQAWVAGDTHQETIINLARLYGRKQRFSKAAGMWDEASRRQLIRGDLRWEAALTYSYAHRYQDALAMIEPLRHQHSKDPKLLLFSGQLNFYLKHWGQAAHYFSAYLELNPQDAEVRRQLAEILSFKPDTRNEALSQYGEILKTKDDVNLRLRRINLLLEEQNWDQAANELQECPTPEDPTLLKQQAHLYLWLGNLPEALNRYDLLLKKVPHDGGARLEKARVLTYLGRGSEALELLNRLRMEQPEDHVVRVAAIEAYLGIRDFSKALALAQKELEPLPKLSQDERALVARCYAHGSDPKNLNRAVELLTDNLWKNRYHHASLLILASVLPRLPRYEDLNRVMHRLPGIKVGGPEQVAALGYFAGQLGRQAGKLNYLQHVLREYGRHRRPKSPGELLGLAALAMELENRPAAARYYERALKLRPHDQSIATRLLQCQVSQKNWSQALELMGHDQNNPAAPLEMAKIYLMRRQFEGVKAMVAKIPANSPDYAQGLLLLVRACRGEQNYPEAQQALAQLDGKVPREELLMEKARNLEGMGDKGAVAVYQEIIATKPDSQVAKVARAREARAQGNWGAAYKRFAQALQDAPQDIELLNELEEVRQQMRPHLASRGFPGSLGERRPEEALRPWQFSRYDRQAGGMGRQSLGLSNYLPALVSDVLPIVQPESLYFQDSNKLHGWVFRVAGGFWITKVLPAQIGAEYRVYNQNTRNAEVGALNLGLDPVFGQQNKASTRLQRAEVSLGLGPLAVADRLKLSGEIILRRYWQRTDLTVTQQGQVRQFVPLPLPPHFLFIDTTAATGLTFKEARNRLLGSLELGFSPTARTDATLRYSRRDIFDQDSYVFPRLYQSVLNLTEAQITTYQQVDLSYSHQFRPGLDWRGMVGGAFYSDQNRRLTFYQGLNWQAIRQPRMHLEFNPHYFLAAYSQQHEAYFSPKTYNAIGIGVNFDKQIFRLPTLILQGTVQAVGEHGDWGPSFQGLAALEWEFVQNFYMDLHAFYFKQWVDDYRLFTAGVSFRWRF